MAAIEKILEQKMLGATKAIEKAVDDELERLENMEEDDLAAIRKKRMDALKQTASKKQDWINAGHGEYSEIDMEKEFFEVTKNSALVVCHFYKEGSFRCDIVDKHLKVLAKKHMETKFVRLNVEKAPFLTQRLKIRVIPTLAVIKDSKTRDFIVGFTELGNTDDFTTEMLEWRLGTAEALEYNGDLLTPPDQQKKSKKPVYGLGQDRKKTIRGVDDDSDSD